MSVYAVPTSGDECVGQFVDDADRNAFWYFLYRYVNHPTKGLLTDFNRTFVATWS